MRVPDPLSIEKGGAVPYRDLVTILRLASMQYITKLAMLQSQKPRFSLPEIIKYEDLKIPDLFFTSQNTPHIIPLVMSNA
jgi:hypothetical protein